MLLSKEEKIIVLLHRVEIERHKSLFGVYESYKTGEDKIRKLQDKIIKLGGNTKTKIMYEEALKE
jgi:hypothetical protein